MTHCNQVCALHQIGFWKCVWTNAKDLSVKITMSLCVFVTASLFESKPVIQEKVGETHAAHDNFFAAQVSSILT